VFATGPEPRTVYACKSCEKTCATTGQPLYPAAPRPRFIRRPDARHLVAHAPPPETSEEADARSDGFHYRARWQGSYGTYLDTVHGGFQTPEALFHFLVGELAPCDTRIQLTPGGRTIMFLVRRDRRAKAPEIELSLRTLRLLQCPAQFYWSDSRADHLAPLRLLSSREAAVSGFAGFFILSAFRGFDPGGNLVMESEEPAAPSLN
jgi:hypothetical protein